VVGLPNRPPRTLKRLAFVSCAPEDAALYEELAKQHAWLVRQHKLELWHAAKVQPGDEPLRIIERRLDQADLILLLISADYFASDDCHAQMMRALEHAKNRAAVVLAIRLRPCEGLEMLGSLRLLPSTGKPVTVWTNRDEAWADVARTIAECLHLPGRGDQDEAAKTSGGSNRRGGAAEVDEARLHSLSKLENAYTRKRRLQESGASITQITEEILKLKRELREGGQIKIGDRLDDRYTLIRLLGRGGFGTVWEAEDRKAGGQVAVKVLDAKLSGDSERAERFFRGARVMHELAHPAVVRVLESKATDGGFHYFVMELLLGGDLRQAVLEGRFSRERTIPLILRIGEALSAAHERGFVHRDIKPANIVLDTAGHPKITDFDLVRGGDTTGGTRTGMMGTFIYAAPEMLERPQSADVRADVYSLAMTAAFCFHGQEIPPTVLREPTRFLRELSLGKLGEVLKKALEWNLTYRFATMKDFCDAVKEAWDPYCGMTFNGRYEIGEILHRGDRSRVYRARRNIDGRIFAVKVLPPDLARDQSMSERFLREARTAGSTSQQNIVDVFDFENLPDGSAYFVMELLIGKSLAHLIDSGAQMSKERICHIACQIVDGMSAAHATGVVHLDLNPKNIFLITRGADEDFVKILDFGMAKEMTDRRNGITEPGEIIGTPLYMSPEQVAGGSIDHRTDIYSLGVILYEMTSGRLPFNADNVMGIMTQQMYKAPVPIRALLPLPNRPTIECPPSLEAVVLKCMSKKPERRYQSMDELKVDLEKVQADEVPLAVADMVSRGEGFEVPADYFEAATKTLAPSDGNDGSRRKSPGLLTVLVSAIVLLLIGVAAGLLLLKILG